MRKTSVLILLGVFLMPNHLLAQTPGFHFSGDISSITSVHSIKQTPFWFWANQLGQIQQHPGFIETGIFKLNPDYGFKNGEKLFAGINIAGSLGEQNIFTATELFGGIQIRKLKLVAGLYAEQEFFSGLASSNGNLLNARNARPYPKLGIQSVGFIPLLKGSISVSGCWEEGILVDERVVDKPRLHHKNLFVKLGKPEKGEFMFGVDHYAFWGGTSPVSGRQPVKFSDYVRTILAAPGGTNATASDQANVAGNSLGQYYLVFRKAGDRADMEFRVIHPFEDKSGMVFFNGIDNLYGVYLTFNKIVRIQKLAFEFVYTRNQSGDDRRTPEGQYIHTNGHDNYLNHGFYSSGFTNFGNVMGSPFFYPVMLRDDGVSVGVRNTRFMVFHVGAAGAFSQRWSWSGKGSYSINTGMYDQEFEPTRNQFSGFGTLRFDPSRGPLWLQLSAGLDAGTNLNDGNRETNAGVRFAVGVTF